MPPDHEQIIRAVTSRLPTAATAVEACRVTVAALGRHTAGRFSALLWVHDRLRCVAATGSWQVFATVPPATGVVGRVYASGKTETVTDVASDPDYLALRPDVTTEICVPILDRAGRPIGVLDLEWSDQVDLDQWRTTAERIADRLSRRIGMLGGPPTESRSEMLLRYASALTGAATEAELSTTTNRAARDVSGLAAAVLILEGSDGMVVCAPAGVPGELESRIRAGLTAAGQPTLGRLRSRAHRYGAAYTIGETGHPVTNDYAPLIAAGVGTLIVVPVGPSDTGGLLLVADPQVLQPDPTTVNLIELLAAQSWLCLERLRGLARLREQANSDPLTGLRHHGSFGRADRQVHPGPHRAARG